MVPCSRAIVTSVRFILMPSMDRHLRTVLLVNISPDPAGLEQADLDAHEAGRIFRFLMSDKVEQRCRFIEDYSANVKNLDI